jgi:putative tryptophan/tyrosine transport system substrate-binding protein
MVLRRANRREPIDRVGIGVAVARCCAMVKAGLAGSPYMRRRDFIRILGSAAAAWPLVARAQQTSKLPLIAILGDDATVWKPWTEAFADRLRELGWIEGRSVGIEYRWSEGRAEPLAAIAAEFVQQKVDVIVTYGGAVTTLKQAAPSIPIVFAIAVDPVGIGLVPNLSHPGGNVTGMSIQSTDLAGKRLELFREVVPTMHRLAIMFDAGYPAAVLGNRAVQDAAHTLGLEPVSHEIWRAEDIPPVFAAVKAQADALYVVENALVSSASAQITALALDTRLPTMFNIGTAVQLGALLAYGPNFPAMFRRAANDVDKILHGTKAGNIPVEQPIKFDLTINLKTATALGLTVPDKMLALADEVIE